MYTNPNFNPNQPDLEKLITEITKDLKLNYTICSKVIKKYVSSVAMATRRRAKKVKDETTDNEQVKADIIRQLYDEGKTIGQISKHLNSNYSYVWSVVDKYRRSK